MTECTLKLICDDPHCEDATTEVSVDLATYNLFGALNDAIAKYDYHRDGDRLLCGVCFQNLTSRSPK